MQFHHPHALPRPGGRGAAGGDAGRAGRAARGGRRTRDAPGPAGAGARAAVSADDVRAGAARGGGAAAGGGAAPSGTPRRCSPSAAGPSGCGSTGSAGRRPRARRLRSGRTARARAARARRVGGDCGIAYVSRQYVLRPGAEPGPMQSPIASAAVYPGYLAIVFPHDNGVFSAMIGRSTPGPGAGRAAGERGVRRGRRGDPAARGVDRPAALAARSPTCCPAGGCTTPTAASSTRRARCRCRGCVFVGDAVCTTNPAAGRGITTSLLQARELIAAPRRARRRPRDDHARVRRVVHGGDPALVRGPRRVRHRPHRGAGRAATSTSTGRCRPTSSSPSPQVDPSLMRVIGPYFGMQAPPSSLRAIEPRAREIYAGGWRPPVPDGPDRAELVELVARASRPA